MDSAHGWQFGSKILGKIRHEKKEITEEVFNKIIEEINREEGDIMDELDWDFKKKTDEFYNFDFYYLFRCFFTCPQLVGTGEQTKSGIRF